MQKILHFLRICKFCCTFAGKMNRAIHKQYYIVFLLLLLPFRISAEEAVVQPDRPGAGTGTTVLDRGVIQWETGFEARHLSGMHALTLPTTSFRFGVDKRAELRLEFEGVLAINDDPDDIPASPDSYVYAPSPLCIGTKIMLWEGSEEKRLKWIPKASLMAEAGLPVTTEMADRMPISGGIDLLFENEITNWFSIGYDIGAEWVEWAPMPDIFASLGFNFNPTEKFGLFVENYNFFDCDVDASLFGHSTAYMVYLNFGATYLVHPRVQLDLYAGFNCFNSERMSSGPQNDVFVGFGVAWLIRD